MVKEGSDVVSACSLSADTESKLLDWKRDGRQEVFMYDASLQ